MQATLATSQAAWLCTVDEWINDLDMRSDGRENRRKVARVLGFNADWKTLDYEHTHLGHDRRTHRH